MPDTSAEPRMSTYGTLTPCFADRSQWSLENIIRVQARAHADKVFLRFPDEGIAVTYAEVLRAAEAVAGGLVASGAVPGDCVVIFADNSYDFILAWFGSTLAGLVEAPVNTAYSGGFLEHQFNLVEARIAIVDAGLAARLVSSRAALEHLKTVYVIGENAGEAIRQLADAGWDARPFSSLTGHAPLRDRVQRKPWDLGAVIFTSGTTGRSKGVMLSNGHAHAFAELGVSTVRLTPGDVYMTMGPLFHANAQILAVYPTLLTGAQAVVRRRFSASAFSRWLHEDQITVTNLIGVMMEFACGQEPSAYDRGHVLRRATTAPFAASVAERFKERFGVEEIVTGYGMTEVANPILSPYGVDRPRDSIGALVDDWYEARLINPETDEDVAVGEVGELLVRSKIPYLICDGYFGMPDKTVEATRNLWFRTGDAMKRDAEGWYYFIDRYKDTVRRRGENVSAQEIETALAEHPNVVDCAIIGVPADEEAAEEEVMAFVVRSADESLTEEALAVWCDENLPKFASPRYIRFTDSIPRTPTEKKRRTELRDIGVDARTWDRDSRKGRSAT